MATTQYKDNAEHIYEFQQEAGDAGGAEKRPVAGMPAAVRTQLTDMTSALLSLAGTVLTGSVKVVLQASSAVIGKLAPNPGVNIGTVDVATAAQLPVSLGAKTSAASLSVVMASDQATQAVSVATPLPAGTNHIGAVAIDAALPAGANAIGKLAPNVGVNIGVVDVNNAIQLPPSLGQRNSATSLGVVIATDQSPVVVKDGGSPILVQGASYGQPLPVTGIVTVGNTVPVVIGTSLPAGNSNIGDVDVVTLPSLPAGSANIGKVDIASTPGAGAATVSIITAVYATVTLAAANANRVGLLIVNNITSTSPLWIRLGSGGTINNWSVPIDPGGYWEMPPRYYTGIVTGSWYDGSLVRDGVEPLALTGDAHVTETA